MPKPKRAKALAQKPLIGLLQNPDVAKELGNLVQLHSGTGAWVWDLPSSTVHWSQEVYRIFDAPDFDNTLEGFQSMVVPEDRQSSLEMLSRAFTTRQTFRSSFRAKTPKGELRLISNVGRALYDEAGKPIMLVGLVADVTTTHDPMNELDEDFEIPPIAQTKASARGGETAKQSITDIREHLLFVRSNPVSPAAADTDFILLKFLLDRVSEQESAHVLATRLLLNFDGFADVLSASRARLKSIEGIKEEHMQLFEIAQYAMEKVLHPRSEPLRFNNLDTLIRYLRISHAYRDKEQLRVIFLDRANHVLANEVMQEGTVDHTPVYTREVIKRALELSAMSLFLVHNHPSGDPTPSRIDIELTKEIASVAAVLGINVRDHIILGRYGHTSLKTLGVF